MTEATAVTGFDRFWSAYPRKVARGAAQKAWDKLNPDKDLTDKIVLAVDAQKRNRRRIEEQNEKLPEKQRRFVPDWKHPGTWLNQQCWLDELQSTTEISKRETLSTCANCGQESKWIYPFQGKRYCSKCYDAKAHPEFKREVYARLCAAGLGKKMDETKDDYLRRLRTTGMQSLARIQKGAMALGATERPRTRSTVAAGETVQSDDVGEA